MSSDKDLEDELLRRFQALKSTPTSAPGPSSSFRAATEEQVRKAKEEDEELERIAGGRALVDTASLSRQAVSEDDEMRKRIARLRGEEVDEVGNDDEDDAEVEAFIASLSNTKLPDAEPSTLHHAASRSSPALDSSDRNLERDARDLLNLSQRHLVPSEDKDEGHGDDFKDLETEEEIIARAIEESRLETSQAEETEEGEEVKRKHEGGQTDLSARLAEANEDRTTSSPQPSFPSLPSHAPVDAEDDPVDPDADAKMALLLGLSGPRTAPGPPRLPSPPKEVKRKPGQGWNLPGYKDDRDNDPDSWCCICNKDADVICLGCDDDPYCESCWMEGHVGQRHRTKRFATKGGKRAVGA